ncbi:MAG: T9SS type A sorting domain-containing protein [Bacteroidales bacterium]|nr:T9SS type A sorting domain-containing protein [Bacteroidales bacterium]
MKKLIITILGILFLSSTSSFGQLNGTYTIGAGQDLVTLSIAFTTLDISGADGPVVFEITDTYDYTNETFPLTITEYPGCSGSNNLTIKPASGVSAEIIGSSETNTGLITVQAPYVVIDGSNSNSNSRDLLIYNTYTSDCVGIFATAGNFTLKNTIVQGFLHSANTRGVVSSFSSNDFYSNNEIRDLNVGFLMNANSNYYIGYNHIHNINSLGIRMYNAVGGMIRNNIIEDVFGDYDADVCGISGDLITGDIYIINNIIDSVVTIQDLRFATGIFINASDPDFLFIANNSINNVASGNGSTESAHPAGICISSPSITSNLFIYHNTVNMTENTQYGLDDNGTASFSSGIYNEASGITLKNNIINNFLGKRNGTTVNTKAYAIFNMTGDNPFVQADYNLYNADADVDQNVMAFSGGFHTFDSWHTYTSMEAASYFENPLLDDSSYLQTCSKAILNGIYLLEVVTDILTNNRNTEHPTIGAYEYQIEQATNVLLDAPVKSHGFLSWTNGTTCKYAVFIKEGDVLPETPQPVDRTTYVANTEFGSGDEIGSSGWFCVYNGEEQQDFLEITNVLGEYTIMVCGYFGDKGNEVYLTETNATNPVVGYGSNGILSYDNQISIFPNPTFGQITIYNDQFQINSVEIIDLTGKVVYSAAVDNSVQMIDISSCKSGVYFLKTNNGQVAKIIKR